MTLRFGTMEEKFLVYVYVGVWVIQLGYVGRIAWEWFRVRKAD